MSNAKNAFLLLSAPAALALGTVGVVAVAADQKDSGTISCEIHETATRTGVALEGLVMAKTAVDGSYRFKISASGSSGNSDINQGGEFSAKPKSPVSLGSVMLGGSGTYDARLELTIDGRTIHCSKRIRGTL